MQARNRIRAGIAVFVAWATLLLASVPPRVGVRREFADLTREDVERLGDWAFYMQRLEDLRIVLTIGTILVTAVAAIGLVHWLREERRIWVLLTGPLTVVAADVSATVIVVVEGSPRWLALELVAGLIGLVLAGVAAFSRRRPRRTPASPGRTAPA